MQASIRSAAQALTCLAMCTAAASSAVAATHTPLLKQENVSLALANELIGATDVVVRSLPRPGV